MRDTSIPSFLIPQDRASIDLIISQTDALLNEQGFTYNQSGFTYNQLGIAYGGVYNANQDVAPIISSLHTIAPGSIFFSDVYTKNTLSKNQSIGPGWFMFVTQ